MCGRYPDGFILMFQAGEYYASRFASEMANIKLIYFQNRQPGKEQISKVRVLFLKGGAEDGLAIKSFADISRGKAAAVFQGTANFLQSDHIGFKAADGLKGALGIDQAVRAAPLMHVVTGQCEAGRDYPLLMETASVCVAISTARS
jgi:hypothetical protein